MNIRCTNFYSQCVLLITMTSFEYFNVPRLLSIERKKYSKSISYSHISISLNFHLNTACKFSIHCLNNPSWSQLFGGVCQLIYSHLSLFRSSSWTLQLNATIWNSFSETPFNCHWKLNLPSQYEMKEIQLVATVGQKPFFLTHCTGTIPSWFWHDTIPILSRY